MTIKRPMFPPAQGVARRSFLTGAASAVPLLAIAPAALWTALPSPAVAAERVASPPVGVINPDLIEWQEEIDQHLTVAVDLHRAQEIGQRAAKTWEARNPYPRPSEYELPSSTARSDWWERKNSVYRKLNLGKIGSDLLKANERWKDAVAEFAAIRSITPADLVFKAEIGMRMDDGRGTIGRAVMYEIVRLHTPDWVLA